MQMIVSKSISLVLAMFTILMVLTVPWGGVLQTVAAQSLGVGIVKGSLAQLITDEANTDQDSSGDNNILENENELGDDVAIVDEDNLAEQDAINVGTQDQDAEQEAEQEQDAANTNVDVDVQVGEQIEQPLPPPPPTEEPLTEPTPEPTPTPPPPTEEPLTEPTPTPPPVDDADFYCFTANPDPVSVPGEIRITPISAVVDEDRTFCFTSQQECEEFRQAGVIGIGTFTPTSECEPTETPPPNAVFPNEPAPS